MLSSTGLFLPVAFAALAAASVLPLEPKAVEIVGGTQGQISQYSFLGAIRTKGDPDGFFCGSTLLTDTRVMTAAHCLSDGAPANTLEIRFGSNDQTQGGTVINVKRYKIHPDYDTATTRNDIAIIDLEKPAPRNLRRADLPWKDTTPPVNTTLKIVGWGATETGGAPTRYVRQAQIQELPAAKCAAAYPEYDAQKELCAGAYDGSRDTCQGDSGGPLIRGTCTVVGVVSYGAECASAESPGVYTSTSRYLRFIYSRI